MLLLILLIEELWGLRRKDNQVTPHNYDWRCENDSASESSFVCLYDLMRLYILYIFWRNFQGGEVCARLDPITDAMIKWVWVWTDNRRCNSLITWKPYNKPSDTYQEKIKSWVRTTWRSPCSMTWMKNVTRNFLRYASPPVLNSSRTR